MKTLLDWIDNRTGLRTGLRQCIDRDVPGGVSWWNVPPATIVFAFVVQLITGMVLWMFYSPSAQTAWESVYFLQYEVAGGWLLRGIHHYAAQVLVALTGLYILQMVFRGTYRAPREWVFWVAVLMGLCSLGLCLTGDLLAWDQNSYCATLVRTNFLKLLPGVGDDLFKLAAGGPSFGHLTLTRFMALHIGLFTVGFFALLLAQCWVARRAAATTAENQTRSVGCYWPDQAIRNASACLVVMVAILLLVARHGLVGEHASARPGDYLGVALGAPADPDPANFYAAARPEWSFRSLYQLSNMFPGSLKIVPIFGIPSVFMLMILAIPFIGKIRLGHWFNMGFVGLSLLGIVVLSVLSYMHDIESDDYGQAVAEGVRDAARVKVLAQSPNGIPVGGALALMREDPKIQGERLYKRYCLSCHAYADADGQGLLPDDEPSAPNLHGFATKEWFIGLFDPKRIVGEHYFGNTEKFADGTMVDFVKSTLDELREEDEVGEEALQDLIATLVKEAKLDGPRTIDGETIEGIDQDTMYLFEDFTCVDCHRFYTAGYLGECPDLTGYGSRQWLTGIISDPSHKRFYGSENDRMPAFAEEGMTGRQIEMLVEWLRGEWYEPLPVE